MGSGDKMSREYELRDLLKSQSLDNVAPSSFQSVGGVVFPDRPAKFDLNDFVEVVNAFKAVHLPTNGACPIPGSTSFTTVTQADTSDGVTLLTAGANEVLEIMSVYATVANDYGLTTGRLTMNDYPIANLGDIDGRTSSSGAMIFGNSIDETSNNKQVVTPSPLYLNGGDYLGIVTKNTPSSSVTWGIVYRKVMQ